MKNLGCLLLVLYSGLCQAAFPGKLDVYALLLASPNPDDVKMGATSIQQDGVKQPELLDLAAERMCMYVHGDEDADLDMDSKRNLDTVSWLAKALGYSGDAKYRPFLEEALAKTKRDKNKQYFGQALAQLPAAPPGAAYEPSCPTLAAFRAQALAGRVPAKPSFKDASNSIIKGDSLDTVIAKLGAPTTARIFFDSERYPFVGKITTDDIQISYLGAATLQFNYDKGWHVTHLIQNVADPAADPASPDVELLDGILSGVKDIVSDTVDAVKDNKAFPTDILDAAARRVWYQRDTSDGDTLDALEDICDMLGESKNPRYRTLLTQVAQKSAVKKLQKYANEALAELPAGDAEQLPVPSE